MIWICEDCLVTEVKREWHYWKCEKCGKVCWEFISKYKLWMKT